MKRRNEASYIIHRLTNNMRVHNKSILFKKKISILDKSFNILHESLCFICFFLYYIILLILIILTMIYYTIVNKKAGCVLNKENCSLLKQYL